MNKMKISVEAKEIVEDVSTAANMISPIEGRTHKPFLVFVEYNFRTPPLTYRVTHQVMGKVL